MRDQQSLSRAITDSEEAIKAERDNENIIFANLGQALFAVEKNPAEGEGGELFEPVRKITREIHDLEASLRQLLSADETRKELQEESRTLKVEARNLNNRMVSVYEDLGKASWELWKSGHQPDGGMEEALGDLTKADEKRHSAEVAAFRNDSAKSSGTAAFFSRGKALLIAGRKRTATAAMDRQWGKAGRSVYERIDIESLRDTPASNPLATLKALNGRLGEIAEREGLIATEIKNLDAEIDGLPGKGGVKKRVSWTEKSIWNLRKDLDNAFLVLGKDWIERNPKSSGTGEVEKCRVEWVAIHQKIGAAEDVVKALKAHRNYLDARDERDRKAKDVDHLDEEIKKRQTILKTARKELTALEKNLKGLEEALPPLPEEL